MRQKCLDAKKTDVRKVVFKDAIDYMNHNGELEKGENISNFFAPLYKDC